MSSFVIKQNILQNQEDFILDLNLQPEIFKKTFFTKILEQP